MSIDGTEETYMAEQAKFDEFYSGYDEEYAEDIESGDGCDHCGAILQRNDYRLVIGDIKK